jgi:hypothetical protein
MRGDDQQLQTGMFSYVVLEEPGKVAEALKKLQEHREPEAKFMRTTAVAKVPAYNVQAAVDSQHALIVAQQVTTEATDNRSLLPMAEAAKAALGQSGSAACSRGCRLFQWRTGRSLRSQRHPSACARQSRGEQSRRWKPVWPQRIHISAGARRVPLPRPDRC